MKSILLSLFFFGLHKTCFSQLVDTSKYDIKVIALSGSSKFFAGDRVWRGADGASSIDLENGKVLWLFSDSFISADSSGSRQNAQIIRNSIAIQDGYNLQSANLKFFWDKSKPKPGSYFKLPGNFWFWTGHGVMIKDKLIIFLMQEQGIKKGLGFEAIGWYAALISNPNDNPEKWDIQYIKGAETFGTIAGSGAVLKDDKYLYAYGSVEPATHEVYLLRWKQEYAYAGNLANPEWWINGKWTERKKRSPIPAPLFIGETEYSIHYNTTHKKFIQIQSFGFGEGKIGIRMSDSLHGKWTEPYLFFSPVYPGVKKPFMYSAKAHPELKGDGIYVTYNVNSFDFNELKNNQNIYFPEFLLIKILERSKKIHYLHRL